MTITRVYAADILKAERNADGDLVVFGKATGPDLDLDKQICDPTWLKTAMPAWMEWGNVREQHSSIAAGVATDLEQDGDSWMVRSVVVDANSARKVEKGVLKGYSIGIKNPRVVKDATAPGGRIVGGDIVEVSLVDRPCNATCTLVVSKAATPGMEVAAADFDEATGLVRVEELLEGDAADLSKAPDPDNPGAPTISLEAEAADAPVAEVGPDATKAAEPVQSDAGDDLDARIERAVVAALAKQAAVTPPTQIPAAPETPTAPAVDIDAVALRAALKGLSPADLHAGAAHLTERATDKGRADLLPQAWKDATPDLAKGDWVHDPAQLAAVRDGLIGLMKAELDEFTQGDDERCDLYQLLRTLSLYLDWWTCEAAMGETASPFGPSDDMAGQTITVDLAAEPETAKTVTPETPALSEERVNELITAAVTKATEASKGRVTALEVELAKVKSAPIPGGPVLTRTAADTNRAAVKDEHLAKAARYRAMADQVPDSRAKAGYLQMAADATKAAESDAA